jgi:hypothetical protein
VNAVRTEVIFSLVGLGGHNFLGCGDKITSIHHYFLLAGKRRHQRKLTQSQENPLKNCPKELLLSKKKACCAGKMVHVSRISFDLHATNKKSIFAFTPRTGVAVVKCIHARMQFRMIPVGN